MNVYISGPVTGNKDYKEQFGSMSYLLKREGHGAVNPVQIMEPVRGVLDYKTILQADLELLEGCDAILLLPGWQDSHGACKEYDKEYASLLLCSCLETQEFLLVKLSRPARWLLE